jgi:hypothetical protein
MFVIFITPQSSFFSNDERSLTLVLVEFHNNSQTNGHLSIEQRRRDSLYLDIFAYTLKK